MSMHLNISLKLILITTHLPFILQLMKHKLINSDIMMYTSCDPVFVLKIYITNDHINYTYEWFEEAKR